MMTKEQEDYIFKLKAELMFRGKDEDEVHAQTELARSL